MVDHNKMIPNQRQLEFKYPSSSMFSMTSPAAQDLRRSALLLSTFRKFRCASHKWELGFFNRRQE